MRRLAQGIVGAVATGMMLLNVPWGVADCVAQTCLTTPPSEWGFALVQPALLSVVIGAILTMVVTGVLGMQDFGRTTEGAVLAALGQSQGSSLRGAARRGLFDGAVAVAIAYLITGAIHVWLVAGVPGGASYAAVLWLVRLEVAAIFAAVLMLGHVFAAARPRRTPVERMHEGVAAPRERRVSLRTRALVLGAIIALALGVLVGVVSSYAPADAYADMLAHNTAQGSRIIIGLTLILLFFAVGVPLARMAIPTVTRWGADIAGATGAIQVAEVVRDRAATTSAASSRTVMAICGLGLLGAMLASQNPAPALDGTYVGAATVFPASAADEVAAEYSALPGVGAVVAAPLLGEASTIVGVEADDIEQHDPVLAGLLREHPSAGIGDNAFGSAVSEFAKNDVTVSGIVPISTCCMSFIDADLVPSGTTGVALLIYADPKANAAEVSSAAANFVPDTDAFQSLGGSFVYFGGDSIAWWGLFYELVFIGAICVGPVVALAVGVAARRRRDDATLAALGATRRTLTGAAVLETTLVALVAAGAGLLGGAAIRGALVAVTRLQDQLSHVITDSYLAVALRATNWGRLALIYLVAVAVFAIVAWLVGRLGRDRRPAEMLRAAQVRGL